MKRRRETGSEASPIQAAGHSVNFPPGRQSKKGGAHLTGDWPPSVAALRSPMSELRQAMLPEEACLNVRGGAMFLRSTYSRMCRSSQPDDVVSRKKSHLRSNTLV